MRSRLGTLVRTLLSIALLSSLGYLCIWPTSIQPKAWHPPDAPALVGPFAGNDRLHGIERIALDDAKGPEYIEADADGRLYTGLADGRVVSFNENGGDLRLIANTHGRPLGMRRMRDGSLIVADAERGLLRVSATGTVAVLSASHAGLPFRLTDDVAVSSDETSAYFTDASSGFNLAHHPLDILEHAGRGRLLHIDLATGKTRLLLQELDFANGVVLSPDETFLLISETGSYRVLRYWLSGEGAGTHDVFIDNLPGFPDNITFNGRDRYWLALANPRNAMLDWLGPYPGLRKAVGRLPATLRPQPVAHAFALALNLEGRVVENLQYAGDDAYAPVTTVREVGDWLYFGSLTDAGIGRLRK
jgi:sugar lactone lactonase YvrE